MIRVDDFDGDVCEPDGAGNLYHLLAHARIVKRGVASSGDQNELPISNLDFDVEAQFDQALAKRGNGHRYALTPPNTLSEPERNPQRSIATRV